MSSLLQPLNEFPGKLLEHGVFGVMPVAVGGESCRLDRRGCWPVVLMCKGGIGIDSLTSGKK